MLLLPVVRYILLLLIIVRVLRTTVTISNILLLYGDLTRCIFYQQARAARRSIDIYNHTVHGGRESNSLFQDNRRPNSLKPNRAATRPPSHASRSRLSQMFPPYQTHPQPGPVARCPQHAAFPASLKRHMNPIFLWHATAAGHTYTPPTRADRFRPAMHVFQRNKTRLRDRRKPRGPSQHTSPARSRRSSPRAPRDSAERLGRNRRNESPQGAQPKGENQRLQREWPQSHVVLPYVQRLLLKGSSLVGTVFFARNKVLWCRSPPCAPQARRS